MITPKEEVKKILDKLPDNATFEDIQYNIYVCQKIAKGLKDIEAGRVKSQEEVEDWMKRWIEI